MAADLLQGDLPSTVMSSNMRGTKNSAAAFWAFLFLYLIHIATQVLTSMKDEKNHTFNELRRKIFIPLITFGSYYLLNNRIGWFIHFLYWVQMLSYIAAHVVCLLEKLRESNIKKYVLTAAHGSAVLYWIIYYIMQIVEY